MKPVFARGSRLSLVRAALLAGTALVWPALGAAQTAPAPAGPNTASSNGATAKDGDSAGAEIVVTAQKREQTLQSVPISIQALDTRKLDQLQVQKFEDYIKYLPSVSTSGSNPGNNATVVVRGIATDGGNSIQGTLPTVGIYLDEQPITTINGALDLHIYDVARVEALSGPQGTLFGASSEAGTLRVITNKPDFTKFSAGYDLELNKYTAGGVGGQAEGFLNQPINDRMALRVVGFYSRDGGYIDNLFSQRTYPSTGLRVDNRAVARANYNTVDTAGGRAALAIKLNEDWTVTPSITGQYQYREGSFSEFPQRGPGGALVTQRFGKEFGRDQWFQAGLTITGKVADFDITYAGSYLYRPGVGDGDYADYSFFYDKLYSQASGIKNNAGQLIDPTQSFRPSGLSAKVSQEARVATPTNWFVHGILGVFYQNQTEDFRYDYQITGLADSLAVTGNPGAFYLDDGERVDRDFAVFTQWDVDITKKLTLTAGARYYRYDNTVIDFNGTKGSEAGCIGPARDTGGPCTTLGLIDKDGKVAPLEAEGNGFTYKFNATYKFDRDHLLYATVSDGFRPGGINTRGVTDPSATVTYGAESLTNYEVGSKNTLWNRRATFNAVLFWEEWDGLQLQVETFNALTGTGGLFTTQNAGKARSRGAEVDFSIRPITGLSITSAATYTKAELTQAYDNGFSVVAPKGETLPFTPAFKANVIARYEFPFRDFTAHVQGAEVYQSSSFNNFEQRNRVPSVDNPDPFGRRNAYAVTDLTAGLSRGDKTLEVYISNLLDRRGITAKSNGCGVSTCSADRYVIYNQPRLIGVRFGQRF